MTQKLFDLNRNKYVWTVSRAMVHTLGVERDVHMDSRSVSFNGSTYR